MLYGSAVQGRAVVQAPTALGPASTMEEVMWTIQEGCERLNATEPTLFLRAHRVYGKTGAKPLEDLKTYEEVGVIPKYVVEFLEYQRTMRAVG